MSSLTRREFVRKTTLVAAAAPLVARLSAADSIAAGVAPTAPAVAPELLRWLEGQAPSLLPGASWGRSWPRGHHTAGTTFALHTADGTAVPLQSWPLATWPDGSLKWTAHAIPAHASLSSAYRIAPGTPAPPRAGRAGERKRRRRRD